LFLNVFYCDFSACMQLDFRCQARKETIVVIIIIISSNIWMYSVFIVAGLVCLT
jgi:hypothetical protein